MTYFEIAKRVDPLFDSLNTNEYENILYLIGYWIDKNGLRAVHHPTATILTEWDGDEKSLAAYIRRFHGLDY